VYIQCDNGAEKDTSTSLVHETQHGVGIMNYYKHLQTLTSAKKRNKSVLWQAGQHVWGSSTATSVLCMALLQSEWAFYSCELLHSTVLKIHVFVMVSMSLNNALF